MNPQFFETNGESWMLRKRGNYIFLGLCALTVSMPVFAGSSSIDSQSLKFRIASDIAKKIRYHLKYANTSASSKTEIIRLATSDNSSILSRDVGYYIFSLLRDSEVTQLFGFEDATIRLYASEYFQSKRYETYHYASKIGLKSAHLTNSKTCLADQLQRIGTIPYGRVSLTCHHVDEMDQTLISRIESMANLKSLSFRNISEFDLIQFSKIRSSSLTKLHLGTRKLSGKLLFQISKQFPNLTHLSLDNLSQIELYSFEQLHHLSQLQSLTLSLNGATISQFDAQSIAAASNLKSLSLRNIKDSGALLLIQSMQGSQLLEKLSLQASNKLSAQTLLAISKLKRLEVLDLAGTKIQLESLVSLKGHPTIRILNLNNTNIRPNAETLSVLSTLDSLSHLFLNRKSSWEDLDLNQTFRSVRKISINLGVLNETKAKALSKLFPNVQTLSLKIRLESPESGEAIPAFRHFTGLLKLHLIIEGIPHRQSLLEVAKLPQLKSLHIDESEEVDQEILFELSHNPTLESLSLPRTQATPSNTWILKKGRAPLRNLDLQTIESPMAFDNIWSILTLKSFGAVTSDYSTIQF
jgi:hypothetical protein